MEEKKFDLNSIIGFVLIFGILIFMFYQNQPTPEELEAQKAEQAAIEAKAKEENTSETTVVEKEQTLDLTDSTAVSNYKSSIGAFGFTQAKEGVTTLENEVLYLSIDNKGGQIVEAKMKNFVTYILDYNLLLLIIEL